MSHISKDTILECPFLVAYQCAMETWQPVVSVNNCFLTYMDRHGQLLFSKVQVVHDIVVLARAEMAVSCQVTTNNYCPLGVTEGCSGGPPLATSLNQPMSKRSIVARGLNLMDQVLPL